MAGDVVAGKSALGRRALLPKVGICPLESVEVEGGRYAQEEKASRFERSEDDNYGWDYRGESCGSCRFTKTNLICLLHTAYKVCDCAKCELQNAQPKRCLYKKSNICAHWLT